MVQVGRRDAVSKQYLIDIIYRYPDTIQILG